MAKTQISNINGIVGYLHEITPASDSVLIFQLPRETRMLSETYMESARKAVAEITKNGNKVLFVGPDVNVYELAGPEAVFLVLKGLI